MSAASSTADRNLECPSIHCWFVSMLTWTVTVWKGQARSATQVRGISDWNHMLSLIVTFLGLQKVPCYHGNWILHAYTNDDQFPPPSLPPTHPPTHLPQERWLPCRNGMKAVAWLTLLSVEHAKLNYVQVTQVTPATEINHLSYRVKIYLA